MSKEFINKLKNFGRKKRKSSVTPKQVIITPEVYEFEEEDLDTVVSDQPIINPGRSRRIGIKGSSIKTMTLEYPYIVPEEPKNITND